MVDKIIRWWTVDIREMQRGWEKKGGRKNGATEEERKGRY